MNYWGSGAGPDLPHGEGVPGVHGGGGEGYVPVQHPHGEGDEIILLLV